MRSGISLRCFLSRWFGWLFELGLGVLIAGCAATTPVASLAAGPSGRIHFATVTRSAEQFAAGVNTGSAAVITGDLSLPPGSGRVPAVIILHGGSGVEGAERAWARELTRIGMAAFVVDSFSGRGISGFPNETQLSRFGNVADAYRALELLATHPRVDPARVVLHGRSRGGGIAYFASSPRLRRLHLPPELDFAAFVLVFPALTASWRERRPSGADELPGKPVLVLNGTADDATPVSIAREYAERMRRAGADITLFEYPGAHHAFDDPQLPPMVKWRPPGVNIDLTAGYDARAHAQAVRDVTAALRAVLKLSP